MQITRQTEYAIRTLIELAMAPFGELVATKLISQRQNVPEVFLQKTIQILARAGMVATQRGVQGGVRLTRYPEEITIADILTVVEGPIAMNPCMNPGYDCDNSTICRVRHIMVRAQSAMMDELSRQTIAEIIIDMRGE
ncbi:MAG: RrF2 family transcriptional regulator [Chitinophagales bacterium]